MASNSAPPRTARHEDPPSWTDRYPDYPVWSRVYMDSVGRPEEPSQPGVFVQSPEWILPDPSTNTLQSTGSDYPQPQSAPSALHRPTVVNHTLTSILHTKQLPGSNALLHQALADSSANVSPWQSPVEWVREDSEYINLIIRDVAVLTKNEDIKQASFTDQLILYPRLVVYVFAHLIHCSRNGRNLFEFKNNLKMWKTWDNITAIQNHQKIKNYLRDLFATLQTDSHSERTFQALLVYDVIGLAAHLTNIVTNRDLNNQLLARRKAGAQSLLDLLQARLNISIDRALKDRIVRSLIGLSKSSALYPQCLVLNGVKRTSEYPDRRGGLGDVFKGQFQGHQVAIKVLKIYGKSNMDAVLKAFSREAVTWRQLNHPNILPFYGVYCEPTVSLVSPWQENGNVVEFLDKKDPGSNFCILLSLDVAQGLDYLHGLNIIHGDMKGLNILISRTLTACLADFGLASARDTNPVLTSAMTGDTPKGTLRWQAPELSPDLKQHSTQETDIYAYALVCYEMFSGEIPFADIPCEWSISSAVKSGIRPPRPLGELSKARGLTDGMWRLVEECWGQHPEKRPAASCIVSRLRPLPERPKDQRLLDNFTPPPAVLPVHNFADADCPFAALRTRQDDTDKIRQLKYISRAQSSA